MKNLLLIIPAFILAACFKPALAQHSANFSPDATYTSSVKTAPEIASISIYTNPNSKTLVIDYEIPKGSLIIVRVFDVHGNEYSSETTNAYKGRQTFTFDISELFRGGYFLSLEGDDFKETRRFVVCN